MRIDQLIEGLNLETYDSEFKARIRTGRDKKGEDEEIKWLREVSAFANGIGGTIYIGVNDKTHEIEPLSHEEVDAQTKLFYDVTEARLSSSVESEIKAIEVPLTEPKRYVLSIRIFPSSVLPVYVHVNGIPAVFVRKFGRAIIATPEQITDMVIRSEKVSYDSMKSKIPFRMEDLSAYRTIYEKANGKPLTLKALQSSGMVTSDMFFTRGGLLFRDQEDDPITLLKCCRYPGTNRGGDILMDIVSFQGPIFQCVDQAVQYVLSHSANGYRKEGDSRIDFFSYPKRSIVEGIVNAYAHRNYFIDGAQISLDIFQDRLEIVSPGSLLGSKVIMKDKDLGSITPKRRNEVVCAGLFDIRLMEAQGSGFDKIMQDYEATDEAHKPYISSDGENFTLTLPDLTFRKGVVGEDNENPDVIMPCHPFSEYDERVLSCCYTKPRSIIEIASFLGIMPSTYLRKNILEKLVEAGYLFASKKGRAVYYKTITSKVELKRF